MSASQNYISVVYNLSLRFTLAIKLCSYLDIRETSDKLPKRRHSSSFGTENGGPIKEIVQRYSSKCKYAVLTYIPALT